MTDLPALADELQVIGARAHGFHSLVETLKQQRTDLDVLIDVLSEQEEQLRQAAARVGLDINFIGCRAA